MGDRADTAAAVRDILRAGWPDRVGDDPLDEAVLLGSGGLGLDSIDVVELVLACEDELGGRSTEALLAAGPLDLGRMIDHFAAA